MEESIKSGVERDFIAKVSEDLGIDAFRPRSKLGRPGRPRDAEVPPIVHGGPANGKEDARLGKGRL